MKVVEFQNTQGVEVQYRCAEVVERVIAFVLDFVIVWFTVVILNLIMGSSGPVLENLFMLFFYIPLFFFYHLSFELFNDGRSPGKLIVGLKVVRIDGMPLKPNDLLIRWLFRMVDILFSSGAFAAVFCAVTPRAQRLGDLMADTTVIKSNHRKTGLDRVLKLSKLSKHDLKYMKKAVFTEEQMLLMKEVYERAYRFPTPENTEMLRDLANTVAATLALKSPKNPRKFLMAVVKDYVALTR